jgi:hypothetical protein
MKIKTGASLILAYILWAVTLALGAWFAIIGRETFETYLGKYFIQEQGQFELARQARFWDLTVAVVLWLLWFVMLIITEEYYRRGAPKKTVWQRFAKVAGVLILLIFLADLFQNLMLGIGEVGWLRWLLTILELLAGVVLIYISRRKQAAPAAGASPGAAT